MFEKEYQQYLNSDKTPGEDCTEKALIHHLVNVLGYTYRNDIKDSNQLKQNFKKHFERLNNDTIDDKQFENWWITFNSGDIVERFETLRSNWFQKKDDKGKVIKTFKYFDTENIDNNSFEVINQLWTNNNENSKSRFDVIILINGIPIIHIELKRESVDISYAARQINKYINIEAISDFLRYTKLYVITNGTETKYFVNNNSLSGDMNNLPLSWKSIKNESLDGKHGILKFSNLFFEKSFLIDFINNYFVYDDSKKNIKVFRPYQYHASSLIIKRIKNKNLTNKEKSGYVWHATGSGKTLTSFKTCEILAKKCDDVDFTIFLIDRSDLNTQTFNNFQSFANDKKIVLNAVDTSDLIDKLLDPKSNQKIIITTIQKMNHALKQSNKQKLKSIANKKVVFVVDECHRSQIGEMRKNINEFFTNSINIAFTGTPIFDENALKDGMTTEEIFGEQIHRYTSYDAIQDGNVKDFIFKFTTSIKKQDSITTRNYEDELEDNVEYQDAKKIDDSRILEITRYINENYDQLTRNKTFNAMLACSSIPEAIAYYNQLKKDNKLNCAIIYSVNKNDNSKFSEQNKQYLNFLKDRISECNQSWAEAMVDDKSNEIKNRNQDIFAKYKTYIQNAFAKRQYDLLIVVSMLLTGYDSPITNTLFLDKQLRYQSLIQAISRTNRLCEAKESGNIVSFTVDKEEVDRAFRLFTNGGLSTPSLWSPLLYEDAKQEFENAINNLLNEFPSIDDVIKLDENSDEELCIKFIELFRKVLKIFNKIKPQVDFKWTDFKINERTFNQYKQHYHDIMQNSKNVNIIHVFSDYEIVDLEQIRVDVNYLNKLFYNISETQPNDIEKVQQEILNRVEELLKEKDVKELLKEFLRNKKIYSYNFDAISKLWREYILSKRDEIIENAKLTWKATTKAINNLIQEFKLKKVLDQQYVEKQLPEYINNPLYDDDKYDEVFYQIRKLNRLDEMIDLKSI